MTDEHLRFPIGKFQRPASLPLGETERAALITTIADTPARLRALAGSLTDEQLERRYRPGGWTIRQVVHHVPDSHMNAYVRFKLALTEDEPTIKPYDEARWAELGDTRETPIETSLVLLEKLHERWVHILRSMSATDFARRLRHPEM